MRFQQTVNMRWELKTSQLRGEEESSATTSGGTGVAMGSDFEAGADPALGAVVGAAVGAVMGVTVGAAAAGTG